MALFMLQLVVGEDTMTEADAAGRTADGEIVLERTDRGGDSVRLGTYPVEAVTAVFRRAPPRSAALRRTAVATAGFPGRPPGPGGVTEAAHCAGQDGVESA